MFGMIASESLQVTTGIMLVQKDTIWMFELLDQIQYKKFFWKKSKNENISTVANKDLPELSHFNILKLLQDETYEHLKQKISSWVSCIPQSKDQLTQKHNFLTWSESNRQ